MSPAAKGGKNKNNFFIFMVKYSFFWVFPIL